MTGCPTGPQPATDLDLAVLLVNTVDLLDDPPDRLDDLGWLQAAFTQAGHAQTAADLADADLARLRALRGRCARYFFEAETAAAAADPLGTRYSTRRGRFCKLTPNSGPDTYRVAVGSGRKGIDALEARLPAALAAHIAAHGPTTLGVAKRPVPVPVR